MHESSGRWSTARGAHGKRRKSLKSAFFDVNHVWPRAAAVALLTLVAASPVLAETRIRIFPADGGILAAGQLLDIRVEATATGEDPPRGLVVLVNGKEVTQLNTLDAGVSGERGAGGTGASGAGGRAAGRAPANTTNSLIRDFKADAPGPFVIEARTADGASATARLTVEPWGSGVAGAPRARNVIVLLGDGMGAAHRTAARLVSRGFRNGRAAGRLAMDTLDVTGMVMTGALNAVITDSSPGMSAYTTGQKANNNQEGVFPDNTPDPFDNPRVEYLGELLRRTRGSGFNVGIVTTADVTDSTPAANAVHTADRFAGAGIAARFFDERETNGVSVLLGGGANHFMPRGQGGSRSDARVLVKEYEAAGYTVIRQALEVRELARRGSPPARLLGLFHPSHLPVAFDKVGAGRYSDELSNEVHRDAPMLDELARLAIGSLSAHSPAGFYLMIEGASIDKRAHAADAERTIWDVIEFDRAVAVALEFARATNSDRDATNDTLVVVTADHETGGMALVGVGNELYAPAVLGRGVRDYAAVFRFKAGQVLNLTPNYVVDADGYPLDPDPTRKVLLGWAAAPDRYENWLSNRRQLEPAVISPQAPRVSTANPARDGSEPRPDGQAAGTWEIPGFLVSGVIENGASGCPASDGCPADTASVPHLIAGHTATDVPLSASGPGAWQFTGVYENTDVFLKILRSVTGGYETTAGPAGRASGRRP
jgi:alkaline phosphatase